MLPIGGEKIMVMKEGNLLSEDREWGMDPTQNFSSRRKITRPPMQGRLLTQDGADPVGSVLSTGDLPDLSGSLQFQPGDE